VAIDNNNAPQFNQDWFGVDLVAGQSYSLTVADLGGNTFFLDANGKYVGDGQHFTAPTTGHYFAGIEPRSNIGTYNLTLAAVADDHPDLIAYAGNVAVGTNATGTSETTLDVDYYAITLAANTSYRFTVTPGAAIRMLDAAGHVITDSSSGVAENTSPTVFTSTTAGTYYVGVYANGTVTSPVNYTLTAATQPGDLPNNMTTNASVTVGAAATGSVWQARGDSDWFKIDLVQGQSYNIVLTTAQNTYNPDLRFGLYDPSGHQITLNSQTIQGSDLTHTAEVTGTYYISASTPRPPGISRSTAASPASPNRSTIRTGSRSTWLPTTPTRSATRQLDWSTRPASRCCRPVWAT